MSAPHCPPNFLLLRMLNRILFSAIIIIACLSWGQAQITLTNATFPAAGDTLKIASDFTFDTFAIDPPGGPYAWDFSFLNAEANSTQSFQVATNGSAFAEFPNAELVTIDGNGAEAYYDVTTAAFSNLGFSGGDIVSAFPFITSVDFIPPIVERRNPTHFFDINQWQSAFHFAASLSELPSELLDSLGIPTGLIDSIRLTVSFQSLDVIDAFGTLTIPGGTYDVLRQKSTTNTTSSLEAHSPLLGWIDLSSIGIPVEGIGADTTLTYTYFSNSAKEPIAVVTMSEPDGGTPVEVNYKDNGIPNGVKDFAAERINVLVSPNPASDVATFELKNVKEDAYTLKLYDAIGHLILQKKFSSNRESISVSALTGGIYSFTISNGKNQIAAVGQVVVSGKQ